jgi:lipopolysaccharide transport system permease protein
MTRLVSCDLSMPATSTTAAADPGGSIPGWGLRLRLAANEWWSGTARVDAWTTLAWFDVVLRYRRSRLGPWWITLSMGLLLLGLGPLYAHLFGIPVRSYLPYVTLGIVVWSLIASTLQDACSALASAGTQLRQGTVQPSLILWRLVAKHLIQFAHHLVLFVPVAIWAPVRPTAATLLAIPGLLLVLTLLHVWGLILAMACARYRDVASAVVSVLQLLMFLTPVFWDPAGLPDRAKLVLLNPLAQLLELVRSPLLGEAPSAFAWQISIASLVVSAAIAAIVAVAQRGRLVYWV